MNVPVFIDISLEEQAEELRAHFKSLGADISEERSEAGLEGSSLQVCNFKVADTGYIHLDEIGGATAGGETPTIEPYNHNRRSARRKRAPTSRAKGIRLKATIELTERIKHDLAYA